MLAGGEEIEMDVIRLDGQVLTLQPGFKLSLANMPRTWGCKACHSAHGSGVYPSRDVSAKLLRKNKFFYNPATKELFTISDSCWGDYVVGVGAATEQRFACNVGFKAIDAEGGRSRWKAALRPLARAQASMRRRTWRTPLGMHYLALAQ